MKKILWSDLDLELISRANKLELSAAWTFIVQSMIGNFLYSIRKAVEDGLKDKHIKKSLNDDKGK